LEKGTIVMGLAEKFKNLVGIEDIEDDDDEELDEVVEKKAERKEEMSFARPTAPAQSTPLTREPAKTEPIPRRTTASDIMKMIVVEPQGFDECPKLVDSLKAKKPVVINLENLETDVARKIFDFLSGATYALNGNVQKIANNIFVFAPSNVDITKDSTKMVQTAESTIKSPWN